MQGLCHFQSFPGVRKVRNTMIYETLKVGNAEFQTYINSNKSDLEEASGRPFIIICPGGGYKDLSSYEGESVAIRFCSLGFNTGVLKYSRAPSRFPTALAELSEAVALVRKSHREWNTDKDKIAVMGFSAGGHLSGSLLTMWHEDFLDEVSHTTAEERRPNAGVLCYPVITSGEYAHRGSFNNLLGPSPTKEELEMVSLELRVSKNVPPTFIWHTFTDITVPVENSLLFASALRREKIPAALHIFREGEHGLALADKDSRCIKHPKENHEVENWVPLASSFLNEVLKT